MNYNDLDKIKNECKYLIEYLEKSYAIAESAVDITENSLYKIKTDVKEEYSSRYFLETILFTLDDIKNSLKNQISELCSIEFDTKMNEYYQIDKSNFEEADIIPFYRTDSVDDIYVNLDDDISYVFKKPEIYLQLIKNDYNSSENHNE